MIVKDDSPLQRIPKEIPPREILMFEGLRYSANMALLSYGRLRADLHEISLGQRPVDFWYSSLNGAWGVIDSANRFYRLMSKLNISGENPLKAHYQNFSKLRNGFHHIEDWIESKHVKEHYPLFGILSWTYFDPNVDDTMGKIFTFLPGIQQGEKTFAPQNPLGKEFRVPVDNITITANQRAQGQPPIKVDIVSLIAALENTVRQIENSLNSHYDKLNNRSDTYPADTTIELHFEITA